MTERSDEDLLRRAQDRMARALAGDPDHARTRLGELTLRPHQAAAVARLLEILATWRGALLADAVGLGKTYVALAVAREHTAPLIVCPAALRTMWVRALAAARLDIPILGIESLSRGQAPERTPDLVILDEAHHFRTPATRRYEAVAHLAHRARILLLSATPLHNSRRDLTALLALFAGSAVKDWSDAAIARLIVRRDDAAAGQELPAIDGPHPLAPGADDDCLDAILALPPTIPAADEGVAHALTTISLVHLWTSSRAALVTSVRKRLARASALRDAIASGRLPTAAELSAWKFSDDALQLAFPLFSQEGTAIDAGAVSAQLDSFIAAARALLDACRATRDPDDARVALLRMLRERHRGERIVAFSQYANTVAALGRLMRTDPGIALITAAVSRIATGPVAREEILSQFAGGAGPVPEAERIALLLTTDLLSEGIDLRGASVVVHLDLPWNPARMEQRVGRLRRLGSTFASIAAYAFVPPAAAERMLELEGRLSGKMRAARAIVGGDFDPLGTMNMATSSPVADAEALRARLRAWLDPRMRGDAAGPAIAAAMAPTHGWIAAAETAGGARMICGVSFGVDEDPRRCREIVDSIGAASRLDRRRCEEALAQAREWVAAREAGALADRHSAAQRAVLQRLTETVARAPRHRRSSTLESARRTRMALAGLAGVGAERVLASLARSTADDDAWLQSVDTFSALHAGDAHRAPAKRDPIIALILLVPVSPAAGATPGGSAPS